MQSQIAKTIHDFSSDEVCSDWYGMTFRQILKTMDMPGVTVFWGCWTENELDTLFFDETA